MSELKPIYKITLIFFFSFLLVVEHTSLDLGVTQSLFFFSLLSSESFPSFWILHRMAFTGTLDKCKACDKTVYVVDMLSLEGVPYHKYCFKCSHCKGTLVVFLQFPFLTSCLRFIMVSESFLFGISL